MCARANSRATAAAASGKRFGSTTVGCGGHTILTMGGMALGSSNSMLMLSWLIWADARGVMGEDWDTATPWVVEVPVSGCIASRDRFVLWAFPLGYLARIWQ
jgi:hypothetical protein